MKIKFTLVLVAATVLFAGKTVAQQDPEFTQFMNNRLFYNPAFAGSNEKICAGLLYRRQWMGFGGGTAFQSTTNGAVGQGETPTSLTANIHAPIGDRIGLGLHIWNDQQGFEKTTEPMLDLAYKHPLMGGAATLAFGVGVGLIQKGLEGDKLKAIDPADPKIPPSNVNANALDFNTGVYFTMPNLSVLTNFYAGVSATHVNKPVVKYEWSNPSGTRDASANMHIYGMTGAEYDLGMLVLNPNIMYKTDMVKHQVDFNCLAVFNQNIVGGITFRPLAEFAVMGMYRTPFNLQVGYSYEIPTNSIITYSSGSHEISLIYCFSFKYTPPPKIFVPIRNTRFL